MSIGDSLASRYALRAIDVERDGNCLFRSIETFLQTRSVGTSEGDAWNHLALRSATVDFMRSFRSHFMQFLPPGGDEVYLTHMARAGTWGGEPEIVALTNLINRSIEIYTHNPFTNNHVQHERTYVPFTPFAALNEVAPIRLLYFNGTGGIVVPNHYALLVPLISTSMPLRDIVTQARTHAFERITIAGSVSQSVVESPKKVVKFDAFEDSGIEFDELPEYDFKVPRMPFCDAANKDDNDGDVVVLEPEPEPKMTKKRGRSYFNAFEDNIAHGRCRYVADLMAKAEVACKTCKCENCADVTNRKNAFEMFIRDSKPPATTCQLHKIWTVYWQVEESNP